jgi:uncharacterized membrane protein YjjB (DUF3815 family)
MNSNWTNYPISVFTDVSTYLVGRVFLLFSTIVISVFLGSGIAASTGDHVGWTEAVTMYPIMVAGGIVQIWGIFIYMILGFFTVIYLQRDVSLRWLLLPFLLQGFEAYRWCASWELAKH